MPDNENIREIMMEAHENLSDEYDSLIKNILAIELSSNNRVEGEASRQKKIQALIQQFSTEAI